MRKTVYFSIVVSSFLLAGSHLWSQQSGGTSKLGFVNTLEVLYGTEEGKQEIGKVETFMNEQQTKYDSDAQELQRLQEQFANQQRTLNPETRAEMQRQIQERDVKLKRFQEDMQLEINRRRDELLGNMSEKIQKIIADYAQQNNFGAILLRDERQAFVAPSLDITQEIVKLYNERHPVAGGTPAATPTPSAAPSSTP